MSKLNRRKTCSNKHDCMNKLYGQCPKCNKYTKQEGVVPPIDINRVIRIITGGM